MKEKKVLTCIDELYVAGKKKKPNTSQITDLCSKSQMNKVYKKMVPVFRTERVNMKTKQIIYPELDMNIVNDHEITSYENHMDKKEREHYEFAKKYFASQYKDCHSELEVKNSIGYKEFKNR